ncbi:Magnesium and cobalt efflux protein CorC [Geitlerinema sp. FC II]|nr:Magnesium and cobalt efflux protein CorC [Geitlerinema sp. FC II]
MLESAHSRFPVISEDKDHIEGILLAKDLLAFAFNAEKEFNLRDIPVSYTHLDVYKRQGF